MMKQLNIGLLGCGFMGRAHTNAYKRVNDFFTLGHKVVMKAVYDRDVDKARAFASSWGWQQVAERPEDILSNAEIDLVDICTPNDSHCELAVRAAAAGKMVLCEKPLARTVAEAESMVQAVEAAGVPNMIWFNLRRVPAVSLAKQFVAEGRIGQVFHCRANYLQDWTIPPELEMGGDLWRLDQKVAGAGVILDLLSHCIDTAMWLNGPITTVTAMSQTFVPSRKNKDTGKLTEVRVDDACSVLATFANGAMGLFESSRFAQGRNNYMSFELNGSHGSLCFNLEDPQWLRFYERTAPADSINVEERMLGWRDIHVTRFTHPYMDHYWVPGTTLGFEHTFINALADFVQGLDRGEPTEPTFRSGLATQKVCDAIIKSSTSGQWERTFLQ